MNANEGQGVASEAGGSEFERRLRALLVESADTLDGHTRSALTRARYAALEQVGGVAPSRPAWASWRGWAPAGALAMVLLVAVFYVGQRNPVTSPTLATAGGATEVLDMLTDGEAYDLSADGDLELDSDFYEWAAAAGSATDSGMRS